MDSALGKKVNLKWILPSFVFLLVYTPAVIFVSQAPSNKILFRSDQPSSIKYRDEMPHRLVQYEGTRQWLTLGDHHNTNIWISHPDEELVEGHVIVFECSGDSQIKHVDWQLEGLQIEFALGHKLFVPAEMYVGGR